MPVTYKDLVDRKGTIFQKSTGRGFKNPQDLAGALGIKPHQIDWTRIKPPSQDTSPPPPSSRSQPKPPQQPSQPSRPQPPKTASGLPSDAKQTLSQNPRATIRFSGDATQFYRDPETGQLRGIRSQQELQRLKDMGLVQNPDSHPHGIAFIKGLRDAFDIGTPFFSETKKDDKKDTAKTEQGKTAVGKAASEEASAKDDAQQKILERILDAMLKKDQQTSLLEEKERLERERGLDQIRQNIGTFDQEIQRAQSLLNDLDQRIRGGVARESQRLAPMEVILGRQKAIQQQSAMDRANLVDLIEEGGTQRAQAMGALDRGQEDIGTILNLIQQEREQPIEDLETELSLRSSLQNLFPEMEQQASEAKKVSEFTDQGGNRIITFTDDQGNIWQENLGKVEADRDVTIQTVGGRKIAYDANTLEVIKDLGPSTSGSGGGGGAGFTPTERKKLEQAGLLSAPRDRQLDFLYGGAGEEPVRPTSFNVKAGFVGLTESEISDIYTKTEPPNWFRRKKMDWITQQEPSLQHQTPSYSTLKDLWTKFKNQKISQAEGATGGSTGDAIDSAIEESMIGG